MFAVSSMIIVELPAPTPYAGVPELYALRTIGWPPCRNDEIGTRHQRLRHGDVDLRQALQDVSGRAFAFERFAHQPDGLERGLLRARMWREDHHIARLDAVDRIAGRREIGIRGRHDARDDACGLAVLDDALVGDLLDNAYALLAQRVAQHAADLHALTHAAHRVAEAALLDAHLDEACESPLVRHRPCHRLTKRSTRAWSYVSMIASALRAARTPRRAPVAAPR
jgi:hypothetical protein